MTKQLTRRLPRHNTIAFPRELRDAIPDLHAGRVLEIDSISGQSAPAPPFGPLVELKMALKETGKLSGKFVLRVGLQPDAARTLAATLTRLADQAEKQ